MRSAATLMSGKLLVSNNTGSAANINVGLVEQTEVLQLAALASQPMTLILVHHIQDMVN